MNIIIIGNCKNSHVATDAYNIYFVNDKNPLPDFVRGIDFDLVFMDKHYEELPDDLWKPLRPSLIKARSIEISAASNNEFGLPCISAIDVLRNCASTGAAEAEDLFGIETPRLPNGRLDNTRYEQMFEAVKNHPSVKESERCGWIKRNMSPMRTPDFWWTVTESGDEKLNEKQ